MKRNILTLTLALLLLAALLVGCAKPAPAAPTGEQPASTGEAAGTAAALAAKGDGNVDHVDIRELQRILLANGNILHCTDAMKEKETHRNDYHKNAKASDGVMGIKFDSLSYDEGGH